MTLLPRHAGQARWLDEAASRLEKLQSGWVPRQRPHVRPADRDRGDDASSAEERKVDGSDRRRGGGRRRPGSQGQQQPARWGDRGHED